MARLNVATRPVRPNFTLTSPVQSEWLPSTKTHQGGVGFKLDTLSELYITGVSTLAGEDNFYETGNQRSARFVQLVHDATAIDPIWVSNFLVWLRREANLRTIAIVGVAEFVKACLANGVHGSRKTVAHALVRADEPGELLAYWVSRYGRAIPKPIKRGIADAIASRYSERNYLKWDGDSKNFRFADVLALTHPKPGQQWQSDLYRYTLAKRKGVEGDYIPETMSMLRNRRELTSLPVDARREVLKVHPEYLGMAGMTWESVAGWIQGPMTAEVWEAVIPEMGYMALLRNLRNFDQAGVSDEVARKVVTKLKDPVEVENSRQLPMRFLSAYRAAPSLRWGMALEQALDHSMSNIPYLNGNTLILVDTSASMDYPFSKDGSLKRWDAAVIFALAAARRCDAADVVSYSSGGYGGWNNYGESTTSTKEFPLRKGESLLKAVERWQSGGYFLGGGTDTAGAVRAHFTTEHDRVILLTDEQSCADDSPTSFVPAAVPFYTFNLAGYRTSNMPTGPTRHIFGGLTDASFKLIPLLEAGISGAWPWEQTPTDRVNA